MDETVLLVVIGSGVLALLYALVKSVWIAKQDPGNERMIEIGRAVREGAMAFLTREYKILSVFVVAVAILLFIGNQAQGTSLVAVSFIVGALCSGLAGFFGMRVATLANNRTTNAARNSLNDALIVAFNGGSVMGMSVVGLGVIGISILFYAYGGLSREAPLPMVMTLVSGFAMGASSIALFARVGGGIYTKAADVGADLVGKVEAGIPEDDPRNPATIAALSMHKFFSGKYTLTLSISACFKNLSLRRALAITPPPKTSLSILFLWHNKNAFLIKLVITDS